MPSPDVFWLALRRARGVGPRTCKLLIEKFGPPEKIFQLSADTIAAAGVPRNTAQSIAEFRDFEPIEKELCELPNIGARLVKWSDADYPHNLRQIADPPPFLFVRGVAALTDTNCIAIVGARAASDIGRRMAQRLGLELAAKGFTVVSGLARGIDGEAHQGALDARGKTIAVLGCGVDVIYPAEHRRLAEAIIEGGGALVSELPIGTQPLAENFPVRNRILSGLCLGVVIVEAAEKSGSLITARMALEQDRQVFAVPGSPLSGRTRGSNRLLKEGAKLIECVEDVIEELAPQMTAPRAASPPVRAVEAPPAVATSNVGVQQPVARRVGAVEAKPLVTTSNIRMQQPDPQSEVAKTQPAAVDEASLILYNLKDSERLHVDSIIESSGLNAQTVLRLLLELELEGRITQHPGKLFSLA